MYSDQEALRQGREARDRCKARDLQSMSLNQKTCRTKPSSEQVPEQLFLVTMPLVLKVGKGSQEAVTLIDLSLILSLS